MKANLRWIYRNIIDPVIGWSMIAGVAAIAYYVLPP